VRRVEGIQHLKVFENLQHKECVQGFSERFRVGKSSKGFEAFEVVEGKCSNVGPQEDELSEEETDSRNSRWRICEVL
jgi:hypothetical protein